MLQGKCPVGFDFLEHKAAFDVHHIRPARELLHQDQAAVGGHDDLGALWIEDGAPELGLRVGPRLLASIRNEMPEQGDEEASDAECKRTPE